MESIIREALSESIKTKERLIEEYADKIIGISEKIAISIKNGNKLMLCGNGGSAADSQHIAAEFVNRFLIERRPLPAIALTTDSSILTSIGNDYSFEDIFSKQVRALGKSGDILIGISTSGRSRNVINAIKVAKEMEIYTVAFSGGEGGELSEVSDMSFNIRGKNTARIQETHIFLGHVICELVDNILFKGTGR
ncbi:MAG TPA: SIS domain-containing protein [Desulfobacteraceae bacterium]|nr:SIS domain-containing protein [Desulfobacteraceae bacterium]